MAHEIFNINGKNSMAYTGEKPWHGLGQELTPGASIEQWINEAGLDYEVHGKVVQFENHQGEIAPMDSRMVLCRTDNNYPLEVVSKGYKVVQPREIIEIFRSFVEAGDMTLETAGVLKEGRKIWGLARIGKDFEAGPGDIVKPFLLMGTSFDLSMASIATRTDVRVVCDNTMQAALREGKHGMQQSIRIPHSKTFDPKKVKAQLAPVRDEIDRHAEKIKKLHKTPVSNKEAVAFFTNLLCTPLERKTGEVDLTSKARTMTKLWNSYQQAPGAENTAWGLVNAVTHSVDHNPSARSNSSRLDSAWFGAGARLKNEAFELVQETSFLDAIIENTKKSDSVDRIMDMVNLPN